MPRVDPHAIVADEQRRARPLRLRPDLDARVSLVAHELDGVVDQVLEDLHQADPVAPKPDLLLGDCDFDAPVGDPAGDEVQGLVDDLLETDLDGRIDLAPDARQLQELVEELGHLVGGVADEPRSLIDSRRRPALWTSCSR